MKTHLCIAGCAGLSSLAMAAPSLDYQASLDGINWHDSVTATTNSTVKIRALVRWTDVAAYGFANLLFKITASSWDASDGTTLPTGSDLGGRSAFRMEPFSATGLTVGTALSGTERRWYQVGAGGKEGYLVLHQLGESFNSEFSTANPAVVMTFDYTIGSVASRSIEIGGPISRTQQPLSGDEFGFYSSPLSTTTSFRVSGSVDSAFINVIVPAPGTASALLLTLGVATRRRRQST